MIESFKNIFLFFCALLFFVYIFSKFVLSPIMNGFTLLIALLMTISIAIFLFVFQNLSLEKKVKAKTLELAEALVQLKENEEKVNKLLINLHVGVAVFSPEGNIMLCNRQFLELGGRKNLICRGNSLVEQSLMKPLIEYPATVSMEEIVLHLVNEDGQSMSLDEFPLFRVISTGIPLHKQISGIRNPDNGEVRWTMGDHEPEFDESGKLSKVTVTLVDITDRKNSEKALRESENRLSAFLQVMPDMFFLLDRNGKIIDNYLENTVVPPHRQTEFLGRNIKDFVEGHIDSALQNIEQLFQTGEIQTLEFSSQRSGKEEFLEARLALCGDDKVLAVVRNISQRKTSEAVLHNMSLYDAPTGLYNRNFFEHTLDKYLDKDTTGVGIVICDIDGLKLVNDALGHAAGDDYLRTVATILGECFAHDDVVARIGGDEFAVIIKQTTTEELSVIEIKMNNLLNTINCEERIIPVSMSLGYVVGNGRQKDIRELLKMADNLMYREKLHFRLSKRSENIDILTKMLGARDFITEGHGDRMQELSGRMAEAMGMSRNEIEAMRLFAQFHDIGKVGIPDRILFNHGRLTEEEKREMKRHAEIGYRIAMSSPELSHISDWILNHHEWWDGNGYPFQLKGEDIPLQSRILSIVDAYDAMTNNRPYRNSLSKEEALMEIIRFKGTQFDPALVDTFVMTV